MTQDSQNLIWIDLEMTGLDPSSDRIIEVATVITDTALNIVAEGPVIAIHQPEEALAGMDEWNQTHHGQSGLIERVKCSNIDESAAERSTLAFLETYVPRGVFPHLWQQHLPGPAFPRSLYARAGRLFPLP